MSELKHIYRNAANIIKAKYANLKGVVAVLDDVETKIVDGASDPRIHRDLFFDPRIDSQRIGVPVKTAEVVAQQLLTFGLLRLWVRVQCPESSVEEAATILETDDSSDFNQLAELGCEHCGGFHELTWEDCETTFAINASQNYTKQEFDYALLEVDHQKSEPDESENTDLIRCETVVQQVETSQPPERNVQLVALALGANRNPQSVPSPFSVWITAWLGPLIMIVAYLVLIIPVVKYCGQVVAVVVSVVVLIALFLVIRGQVNAKLAPTIVQRLGLYGGLTLSTYCVAAGSTGFHMKGEVGENQPWWSRFDFGELSEPLIRYGITFFALTLLFVFAFDLQRGWLKMMEKKGDSSDD